MTAVSLGPCAMCLATGLPCRKIPAASPQWGQTLLCCRACALKRRNQAVIAAREQILRAMEIARAQGGSAASVFCEIFQAILEEYPGRFGKEAAP